MMPRDYDHDLDREDFEIDQPTVTSEFIEEIIVDEYYHVVPGTTLTLCVLTLRNGFTVVGESACAHPDNFREELGRRYARANAKGKIWQLEGYLLRETLYQEDLIHGD